MLPPVRAVIARPLSARGVGCADDPGRLLAREGKRQRAADVLENWLTTRDKVPEGVQRGLCPATFVRTDHQ
jgi:hypothetical protein